MKTKEKAQKEKEIPDRTYYVLFALISLVALFIRLYQFGVVPGGLNQDGAMAAVDANALVHHGTDRFGMHLPAFFTAWGYAQMSTLLSYLMVPFIKIFGISVVTARLPQLCVSLLGLVCLFFFCRDVFGKKAALVIYLFAAINPWHIIQSRWALEANMYPHFFLFGIFFLHRALKKEQKKRYLALSMVMFGLCMYCYGVSIYTMPFFLLLSCIYLLLTKKVNIMDALLSLCIYLLVGGPFIMVMAINYFHWDTIVTPFFTLPYFPDSVRSNDIVFFSDNVGTQLLSNLKSLADVTIFQEADLPWNNVAACGSMYLFSMPFAFLGLFAVLYQYRKNPGAILTVFYLMTGIWCGLATNAVNINRCNIIYYPIIILTGLGIYEVIRTVTIPHFHYVPLVVYMIAFGIFCHTYFTTWAADIDYYFFGDFCRAVRSLQDDDYDRYYVTTWLRGEESPVVSEILTMFWLDIDAKYFQGEMVTGEELPYQEKFNYGNIAYMPVTPGENAAYVISDYDLSYFDDKLYDFTQFGTYYVVTPK